MAYATVQDVQARMTRTLSQDEQAMCSTLLDDSAIIIDTFNSGASADKKNVVSCRMVIRALGDGEPVGIPMGATQATMSALGYSQSFTMGSGASVGELYLERLEKKLLGCGDKIGSYSPVQELICEGIND